VVMAQITLAVVVAAAIAELVALEEKVLLL
jgi:hypothetical protein